MTRDGQNMNSLQLMQIGVPNMDDLYTMKVPNDHTWVLRVGLGRGWGR